VIPPGLLCAICNARATQFRWTETSSGAVCGTGEASKTLVAGADPQPAVGDPRMAAVSAAGYDLIAGSVDTKCTHV